MFFTILRSNSCMEVYYNLQIVASENKTKSYIIVRNQWYPENKEVGETQGHYSAHWNALSRACKDPGTKGFGGFGSLAIEYPTGIRTALIPMLLKYWKSVAVIKESLCFYIEYHKKETSLNLKDMLNISDILGIRTMLYVVSFFIQTILTKNRIWHVCVNCPL